MSHSVLPRPLITDSTDYTHALSSWTTAELAAASASGWKPCHEREGVDQNSKKRRSHERERVDFGTWVRVKVHSLTLVATRTCPLAGARSYHRSFGRIFLPSLIAFIVLTAGFASTLPAAESVNMAERSLKKIVDRQKEVFTEAARQGEKLDEGSFKQQMQSITHDYELLLRNNPAFAAGYAAYGYLLSKVDMRHEATAMLLKANQLDPDIGLVKNQLGNLLAEDGKPLQAAPYYIAAIKLEPNEPLYHYQLGTLLSEARDEFLKSGEWTRETVDNAMHHAFKRAAEIAPDRFEFAYRFAESFYDLEKPDWNAALQAWNALEQKAPTAIERQTMRLHAANVCLKMGKREDANGLLKTVDEPKLQGQKEKLVAQLTGSAKN
jgi:tetratricopeptide (TPR) repeat protein